MARLRHGLVLAEALEQFGRHQPPVRTHRAWRASAVSAGGIGGGVQPASSSPLSTGPRATTPRGRGRPCSSGQRDATI